MNQEETHAEAIFKEALLTSVGAFMNENLSPQEKASRIQQAIELCQKALPGLPKRQKISCHQELGLMLFYMARSRDLPQRLASEDIDPISTVGKALKEMEKALFDDAETGERVFSDRVQQARLLQTLDFIWQSQSLYIKNRYGQESKFAYLQDKLKKIEYLDGVSLPGISFSLAHFYGDARNFEMATKWFEIAANAQDYGDVIGIKGTDLHLGALAVKKEAHDAWQSLLAYSANKAQKEREGLIAKRRAAGECEICGTKLGFFEKAGGNVRCKAHR